VLEGSVSWRQGLSNQAFHDCLPRAVHW
jgi:hypothetical protein